MFKFSQSNFAEANVEAILGTKNKSKKPNSGDKTSASVKVKLDSRTKNGQAKASQTKNKSKTPTSAQVKPKKKKVQQKTTEELMKELEIREQKQIDEENSEALQQALLASRLEEQRHKARQEELSRQKKSPKQNGVNEPNKKKKKVVLSLSALHALDENKNHIIKPKSKLKAGEATSGENFFDEIDKIVAKTMLGKNENAPRNKSSKNVILTSVKEEKPVKPKVPKMVSYDEVEKRDFEIQAIRMEVESLKQKNIELKRENLVLHDKLSNSEAGALLEMNEALQREKLELLSEVGSLSQQLEQEKSANRKK